ncbi:class I SAM-dependent methyltransferase [Bradyrhizobium sp. USDA 3458]|uniref:class I SAM-dependent methyltransferase n=1 Tax=Bradyrhizobium sp. USDA 3458 TaxID=2591461 RepID=UPI00133090F2|nr:class I SAM-dependent methyltransferase [Bradyrhizobium sp. USDA 3458]
MTQLRRAGCQYVLDLGCGPAALLIEMARADTGFRGIGVDQGRAMCRIARERAHEAGVTSRIKIFRADVRGICDVLDERVRDRVDAVHARSVLNAFFGRGSGAAVAFLRELRSAFPGRIAFFVDYYGELGHARDSRRGFRLAALQDVAQLASGQGIPPATRRQWHVLYRKAGCTLVSADDRQQDEIRWFIHRVKLAG